MELLLYGTLGCHLCDQAEILLADNLADQQYQLTLVDISENDELMSMYAHRIPVLFRPDILLELDWPFDASIIQAFLAESTYQ